MTNWFVNAALWVHENKAKSFISLIVILTALGLVGYTRLELSSDLIDLLPKNNPDVAKYKTTLTEFNPLNRTFFTITGDNQDRLIATGDALAIDLEATQLFDQVRYQWHPDEILRSMGVLANHRAALFSKDAEQHVAAAIEPEQIAQTLANWKKTLMTSPAPYMGQVFTNDPVGINKFLYEKLELLQSFGDSMQISRGRLFSADGRSLLIMATPKTSPTDGETTAQFTDQIEQVVVKHASKQTPIAWLGAHRFASNNERIMRADVEQASTISTIGIILLSLFVFRRRALPIIAMSPVLVASVASLGVVPWVFSPVTLIAIGVGSILFGLSIDYGLHILFHLDHSGVIDRQAISETIQRLAAPLSVSALTTILAFFCLELSDLPSYKQFGLIAGVGVIAAWLFSLIFMPTLAALTSKISRRKPLPAAEYFAKLMAITQKHYKLTLAFVMVITITALPGIYYLEADGDVRHLYLSDAELEQEMNIVNAAFGDAMKSITLIVNGDSLDDALASLEGLDAELNKLRKEGQVKSFFSLTPFLPSRKTQSENLARWQQFWTTARIDNLAANLASASLGLGLRPEAFEGFIERLRSNQHNYITVDDYQRTPLATMFESQLSLRSGAKVLVNARLAPESDEAHFFQAIKAQSPHVDIINPQQFTADMIRLVFSELSTLATATLVGVFILLLIFEGLKGAIIILIPLIISMVWTFGFLGWFSIPINVMNCVIVLLVFGLVVDYSVFLTMSVLDNSDSAHDDVGKSMGAISISTLTTICAVGALAASQHPALRAVGLTTLIGISSGFIAVVVTLPAGVKAVRALLDLRRQP